MNPFTSWLGQKLAPFFDKLQCRRMVRRAKKPTRRLLVEPLEDRTLPAVSLLGSPNWVDQGPGPIQSGGSVNPQNNEVGGAIQSIAVDPNNAAHIIIGTVNGGVWATTNANTANPAAVVWNQLTDSLGNLAVGSVAFSPLDNTGNTIFVGGGQFSNSFDVPGGGAGVYRTTDGGATWTLLGANVLGGLNIKTVLPTNVDLDPGAGVSQLVFAAALNPPGSRDPRIAGGQLFRSPDGGATWNAVTGTIANPLPAGAVTQVIADPNNNNTIFAGIPGQGVFRSIDGGVNWNPVNTGLANNAADSHIELAAQDTGAATTLFAAISAGNTLNGVWTSTNGTTWTPLAAAPPPPVVAPAVPPPPPPPTFSAGAPFAEKVNMVADPVLANVIYISGQAGGSEIFRYNPAGAGAWVDITTAMGGTRSHPDQRDLVFVGNTTLLAANDGGVHLLNNPTNEAANQWQSFNGQGANGQRSAELFSVAYNSNANIIIAGAQDNGSEQQNATNSLTWTSFFGGDGAEQEYDNANNRRYSLSNNWGFFRRDGAQLQLRANGNATNFSGLNNTVNNSGFTGGTDLGFAQNVVGFVAHVPFILNSVDPTRILLGWNNVYESDPAAITPTGDVIINITPAGITGVARSLAFGGRRAGTNFANVVIVGTANGQLFVRGEAGAGYTNVSDGGGGELPAGGGAIVDISVDPQDWRRVYLVQGNRVWVTNDITNTGANPFADITDNLGSLATSLRTIELFDNTPATAGDSLVLVGGYAGVFRRLAPVAGASTPTTWSEYGGALPSVVVQQIRYVNVDLDGNAANGVGRLVIATMGRGAMTIDNVSATIAQPGVLQIDGDTNFPGQDDVIRLVRNAANPGLLEVYLNSATPVLTVQMSTLQQINVNGLGGNDTLIVESTNGLINVPAGIRFDGGAGDDRLTLQQTGGTAVGTNATYTLGAVPGSGTHTVVAAGVGNVQTVFFENLEPVLDLVPAATLTINATPADNAINYSTGSLVTRGLVTVDEHESIEFANKTNVVINALAGSDTINLRNALTPTGLTGSITVNGNDDTSGDTLIVNGTAAVTVATGTNTITGAGPVSISYATIEALTVNAADNNLSVTGSTSYTYTPAVAADAGSVQTVSIPIAFTGVGSARTLGLTGSGGSASLTANGTNGNDLFTVDASAAVANVTLFGRATIALTTINSLTLNGLDGTDTVALVGDGNALTATLGGATASVTGVGLAGPLTAVSLSATEVLNLNAAAGSISLAGTGGPDTFVVTPTGANTATAQVGGLAPVVNTVNTGTLTVTEGTAGDGDTLIVNGTAAGETITVNTTAVTVDAMKAVAYTAANVESLRVNGNAGSDIFDVTAGTRPIFIDGGDPVGVLPGDLLNIVAGGQTVMLNPGPETDEGGINVGANQPVSYDHIESISITGPGGAVINGTNGPDAITIIARDDSYNAAANGVQDFTVSVNTGPEILFINTPSVTVNALAGSDQVTLATPAPNNAVWDVDVAVNGGVPAADTDRLIVQTPGAAAETAVYTPSATDGGLLDLTSLSSPVTITGIEALTYDGQGDNDNLTVVATGAADTIIHTPGVNDQAGSFQVNTLLPISYQNMGAAGVLTADGAGDTDTLIYNGTAANDAFSVGAAGQVFLPSRLVLNEANIEVLTLEGFAGDDTFTLIPAISASPYTTINFNGGPQASAAGDKTNLIDTGGADIVHVSGQVVTSAGKTVASSGVEEITLDLLGGTDELIYDGVVGVSEAINVIASTTAGGGQISVPNVTLVTFKGAEFIDVNGNTPAPSDTDTVTFTGTNSVDVVKINLAADGTTADPILTLQTAALTTLLTLRNYTNFATLNVKMLEGEDIINVYTDASGPSRNLFLDGGVPTGKKKSTDNLNIFYTPPRPRIIHSAETQDPDNGLVDLDYGTARFLIQYADIEQVVIRRV